MCLRGEELGKAIMKVTLRIKMGNRKQELRVLAIGTLLEIVTQPLEVSIISKTQMRKWISMVFM